MPRRVLKVEAVALCRALGTAALCIAFGLCMAVVLRVYLHCCRVLNAYLLLLCQQSSCSLSARHVRLIQAAVHPLGLVTGVHLFGLVPAGLTIRLVCSTACCRQRCVVLCRYLMSRGCCLPSSPGARPSCDIQCGAACRTDSGPPCISSC